MSARVQVARGRRLTQRKADRALTAIVELIGCSDVSEDQRNELTQAAGTVRRLLNQATR